MRYLKKLKTTKLIPVLIYLFGLGLLLSTTLASSQLIGSDIHQEYYLANQVLKNGWDMSINNSINGCVSITMFAPFWAMVLGAGYGGLDAAIRIANDSQHLIMVFKVVFPMLYALVPVILYYIYKSFMPIIAAVISSCFFIIVPVFFLEMPQVARAMIGELLIVSMLAVILLMKWNWVKISLLVGGSMLVVLSHYSSATTYALFLVATLIGYIIIKDKKQTVFTGGLIAVTLLIFWLWSSFIASGWWQEDVGNVVTTMANSTGINVSAPAGITQGSSVSLGMSPLIKMGIGLDFFQVDNWSKAFRLVQIITELLLAIGAATMVFKKEVPVIFKSWLIAGCLVLTAALAFPIIANTINPTRLYHLMLMVVAPGIVYACYRLFQSKAVPLAIGTLAVYFLFTSGIVFAIAGYDNIAEPTVPYSIALENKTLDAGNRLTANDAEVARWTGDNLPGEIVYGDLGGTLMIQEYIDNYHSLYLPPGEIPDEVKYLYIREWNTEKNLFAYWNGPGLRKQENITQDFSNWNVLYQKGNSMLLEAE